MSFGDLCSFTPSDPHNVSLLLGSLVAAEGSEVATPYHREVLEAAAFYGITLPPEDLSFWGG